MRKTSLVKFLMNNQKYQHRGSCPTAAKGLWYEAKSILSKAGVDTEIFKAHSVRSASISAAATSGITTGDILKAADWSSKAIFQKFYHKPIKLSDFGKAILSK